MLFSKSPDQLFAPDHDTILVLVKPVKLTDRDMAILSEAENNRALAMTEGARPAFVCARASLRRTLGAILRIEPSDVPLVQQGTGPVNLNLTSGNLPFFSVSHTGAAEQSYIAVAVSNNIRLGVDIEQPERDLNWRRLAERRFNFADRAALKAMDDRAARQRFFELWTLKEAIVKLERGQLMRYLSETVIDMSFERPKLAVPTPAGRSSLFLESRHLGDADLIFGLAAERPAKIEFSFERSRVPFS